MSTDEQKQAAADRAATYVRDGMTVGLGTGSTAERLIVALGRRRAAGLRFTGIPTSRRTADLARQVGIDLKRLDGLHRIDVSIDGADEVDAHLNLIKGHGGALTREKLVAQAAERFVIIIDQSKRVGRLGESFAIPVEVVTFGWTTTRERLESLGLQCQLRADGGPYITNNHNYVLDCQAHASTDMYALARSIKQQTGVVEHGLFLDMATTIVIGRDDGDTDILGEKL